MITLVLLCCLTTGAFSQIVTNITQVSAHYNGTVQDDNYSTVFDYIEAPRHTSVGTVVAIGGINGGFYGPGNLYNDLAENLLSCNLSLLRVDVSRPYMKGANQLLLGLEVLKKLNNPKPIMLVGWSMGSASIINAAKMLIERNDALKIVSFLTLAGQVGGGQAISELDIRINIIHGDNDLQVDVQSAYNLRKWAKNLGEFVIIKGADHNFNGYRDELYVSAYRIIFNDFNIINIDEL